MTVRRWHIEDRDALVPLILAYLLETKDDYDYKPTQSNAEFLFDVGTTGFGVLAEHAGKVIAWASALRTDDRFKKRIAYGMGTYVAPEHRKTGLANILNGELSRLCRVAGFERLDRIASTEAGERMLEASGARQIGRLFTQDLLDV